MDCKDLMIGDWVSYLGFYNKVIYIGQKVSIYNGKGTEFTTDPEHIRPIPLTEDILVKNGWDFTKSDYSVYCKEDTHGDVELSKDQDGFYLSINCDEYVILRIYYVHQLQHLLRLCGIEKKIEL